MSMWTRWFILRARAGRAAGWAALVAAAFIPSAAGAAAAAAGAAAAATSQLVSLARPNAPTNREALLFRNGDLLYGALNAITPQAEIRWQHADAQHVIALRPDNVAEIHFPVESRAAPAGTNLCRLLLGTGDELEGSELVLDQDQARVQTWYAGSIAIPRQRVRLIMPVPPEGAVLFDGFKGVEGWTIGKVTSALGDAGEWHYRNGAFYATNAASIARLLSIPDTAKIEFDLAWKGIFQLAVAIYTDYLQPINLANKDTEPDFAGFYSLQLNSFSANLLPVKKNDPLRYLGQVSVPPFNQKNSAHVEIRASKAKRTVALLVDGQLIKQWTDTEEFAGQGQGLRFVHQGQGKVRLRGLRVSEWDGQSDERPAVPADAQQDVTRLRNGDKVVGRVESVQGGQVTVATGTSGLVIPLARVKQIELAGQTLPAPPADTVNVRAVFSRGGAVRLELRQCENGRLVGASPNFGELAFDTSAFSRLELELRSKGGEGLPNSPKVR